MALSHRGSHIIVQSSKCTSTLLAFTRRHRQCAGNLQKDSDIEVQITVRWLQLEYSAEGPQEYRAFHLLNSVEVSSELGKSFLYFSTALSILISLEQHTDGIIPSTVLFTTFG